MMIYSKIILPKLQLSTNGKNDYSILFNVHVAT